MDAKTTAVASGAAVGTTYLGMIEVGIYVALVGLIIFLTIKLIKSDKGKEFLTKVDKEAKRLKEEERKSEQPE
jgi:hypothetical protein